MAEKSHYTTNDDHIVVIRKEVLEKEIRAAIWEGYDKNEQGICAFTATDEVIKVLLSNNIVKEM